MFVKKLKYFVCLAIIFLSNAFFCEAATENPIEPKFLGISVKTILERIVNFLLRTAGSIALIILVLSGIYYIASNGNSESQQKAKRMLIGAVEGIVIIMLSYSLLALINKLAVQI